MNPFLTRIIPNSRLKYNTFKEIEDTPQALYKENLRTLYLHGGTCSFIEAGPTKRLFCSRTSSFEKRRKKINAIFSIEKFQTSRFNAISTRSHFSTYILLKRNDLQKPIT